MNILFIINGLRYGGMERQLVAIIKALSEDGLSVYLAVLNQIGPMSDQIEKYLKMPIYYLDRRKSRMLMTMRHLHRIINELGIDIVHVQDTFSAIYATPVVKLMGLLLINGAIRNAGYTKGGMFQLEKVLLSMSDTVIANSKAGLHYYGIRKGHVLYNFVDRERFFYPGIQGKGVIMVANFTAKKDHTTLLHVAARLIAEGRIDRIGIVGDGPLRDNVQRTIEKLNIKDKVKLYGQIANVEKILQEYQIGVLCSTKRYKEGISNSLLEYMGAGLIAVGSNIGGTPEIIRDKINGFLFTPESQDSLYTVLSYVIDNPLLMERIRLNATETLRNKFDVANNYKKLISIYNQTLKGKH